VSRLVFCLALVLAINVCGQTSPNGVSQPWGGAPFYPRYPSLDCEQYNPSNSKRHLKGAAYEQMYKRWVSCRDAAARGERILKGSGVKSYRKAESTTNADMRLKKASAALSSNVANLGGSPTPSPIPSTTPQATPTPQKTWYEDYNPVVVFGGLGVVAILLFLLHKRRMRKAEEAFEERLRDQREKSW